MPPKTRPVLVVEDDRPIREALVEFLELEGYKVYSATNGQEALERLEQIERPCVVLLDLFMPIMDGLTFLNVIKKQEKGDTLATLPVIVVSAGAPQSEVVQQAKGLATGFVKKPVDLDLILALVESRCC